MSSMLIKHFDSLRSPLLTHRSITEFVYSSAQNVLQRGLQKESKSSINIDDIKINQ